MARHLRIQYPDAVYHVMGRGNHGKEIFRDDLDRRCFLETLGEACEKTGWRVHAYVLMGNHCHLLVQTPEGNLVAGMKWLQGTYTQRHNGRHKVFGHLFQGRYRAVIVDEAEPNYFQVVSTYIHLNPARAKLIRIGEQRLKRYRWSSYPWYLNRAGAAAGLVEHGAGDGKPRAEAGAVQGLRSVYRRQSIGTGQQSGAQGVRCGMEGRAAGLVCRWREFCLEAGRVSREGRGWTAAGVT